MAEKKAAKKAATPIAKKAVKKPAKTAAKKASARAAPRTVKAERKAAQPANGQQADAQEITAHIRDLGDWRGEALAEIRKHIHEAAPGVIEELKWRKPTNPTGVPVWSHEGIICTGETYKDKVKFTFAKGAALQDPARLFNASLDGGTRRAIDIREGDKVNGKAFQALFRAAMALNVSSRSR